ncbi:zinc-dependent metalloprotease [Chitinophaga rhizophila]|uniref:Zinc-dependent metalloprotease n=1 Tax=Chitinophaga rhizophila TaxID=2866212 RepID=A0ABS7GHD3_9BACT|nr:zinc-dependent metalloprotease [Chitinophaga rhizophila]MBW8687097.1 zinc-dependent metalloprotease [Chitinophaga rhizophila]
MFRLNSGRSAWLLSCVMLAASLHATAQKKKKKDKASTPTEVKADSTAGKKPEPSKLKKYSDVITKEMRTDKGFITVHSKGDDYYFEVPFAIMGKDILIVNRVAAASVDMRNGNWGLTGDQIGEAVYRFEKARNNNLYLRRLSFSEYSADSTTAMYTSVQKNNVQAIAAAFPIVAYNADSSAVVLNMTDFLNSDNDITYFSKSLFKDRAGMGAQQNDRSYVKYVHAYPTNVEVRAFKTYAAGKNPTSANYSVELNSSMVMLPERPARPRLQDKRVGYFSITHRDFDAHPQSVVNTSYAVRWRLEPKPEDVEKYKRGELVEPAKPIVFYIDPSTPKKWVPYLIQGVNDWQAAFEQAGFKNAIYAREAPSREEDSTWSLEDARHSAIIYRPSAIANAMGPNVNDPRTGEILESHIFWYHNVMSVLQKWYFIQCAAVDTGARKLVFDDNLMGDLIRFVSSHEVGHTLGLMHNFGSSSTVPVENLRNKAWVEKYGHTPSIMDYARFNYVAQPEDNIGRAGLYPRINDYDKWAIEWGYRWRPDVKNEWEEQKLLTAIVTDSLKNKRLWFGNEMEPLDPRSQNEDLGDDAMKAGTYGIMNLKRIIKNLGEWTNQPQKDYSDMRDMLSTLYNQYSTYVGHVVRNVGGEYHYEKITSQPGPTYVPVEYKRQKEAVAFLDKELFTTPEWLNEKSLMDKIPDRFGIDLIEMQRSVLNGIFNRVRMTSMLGAQFDSKTTNKVYTVEELMQDMDKVIFRELYEGKSVSFYRRNLQKVYINKLLDLVYPTDNMDQMISGITQMYTYYMTDLSNIMRATLTKELQLISKYQNHPGMDKETQRHLKDLAYKIKKIGERDLKY